MNFKTIQEAFNHYRNHSLTDIETRAQEIDNLVNNDPNADINSLNIELDGLKEAKQNMQQRSQGSNFNPVTGTSFNKGQVPKDNIFESTEYRNAFYKTMLGQKLTDLETRTFDEAMNQQQAEHRANSFNTTTNSAAVLPTQTLNEVINKARKMGGLIEHVRNFNIPTNISVPIGTPASKASWHPEGDEVTADKAQTAKVEFNGYEILKVFSISAAAKKMSIQAFESYLTDELTNAVMETIADALVNGTGTKQGTGLLSGVTWDGSNSFEYAKGGAPGYKDITNMLANLKRGYAANSKFAMSHSTLYTHIYGMMDGNKRPIFIQDVQNESVGHILGKEVVIDDNIEDGVILLGDLEYMGYNMPEGIMLEVSRESSFRSGLVDYRAMAIADTKPLVEEAFVKLSEAAA